MTTYRVGQVIEDNLGRASIIRYIGRIAAAPGDYVGVEFDSPIGKNDGTAKGERYFECAPKHGLFIRPAAIVKVLVEPPSLPTPGTATRHARPVAQASVVLDTTRDSGPVDTTLPRRLTLTAPSPTPSERSQERSAQRPLANTSTRSERSISVSSSTSNRAPTPVDRRFPVRPSLSSRPTTASSHGRSRSAVPVSQDQETEDRAPSTSSVISSATSQRFPSAASQRGGPGPATNISRPTTSGSNSVLNNGAVPALQITKQHGESSNAVTESRYDTPSQLSSYSSSSSHGGKESEQDVDQTPRAARTRGPSLSVPAEALKIGRSREIEALEAKIRIIERKRAEDRQKLSALEKLRVERDRFESVIQKLQNKLQPQQQELAELRKQLKDSQAKLADIEGVQTDHDAALEMATLDREVAEESAETLREELEVLRLRAEELDEEVKLLREENEELGKGVSEQDRTSQGWMQLEKSNERLKEALLRLREMSQSQEAELSGQIKSLKEDLKRLSGIEQQYTAMKARVDQSDAIIEDLRQQLELAAGADDMIEELTEKNLALTEQVDGLQLTVEDLENLKEINDELENGHIEAENQLQSELDRRDTLLFDYARQSDQQSGKLAEYEATIAKFRQLVAALQAQFQDLRSAKNLTEAQAEELNAQARDLINLNTKLQSAASKTQVSAADLELSQFQAQEALEHLELVSLFLVENATEPLDILATLSRMKRILFKSRQSYQQLYEHISIGDSTLAQHTLTCCDVLHRLAGIAFHCERVIQDIQTCSVENLSWYRTGMRRIMPVEDVLERHQAALAADEFNADRASEQLQEHSLTLTHISESRDLPHTSRSTATLVSRSIDTMLLALEFLHSSQQSTATDALNNGFIEPTRHLRQAKTAANKIAGLINDLTLQQQSLNPGTDEELEMCLLICGPLFAALQDFVRDSLAVPATSSNIDNDLTTDGLEAFVSSIKDQTAHLYTQLTSLHAHLTTSPAPTITTPAIPSSFAELAAHLKQSNLSTLSTSTSDDVTTLRATLATTKDTLTTTIATADERALRLSLLEARLPALNTASTRLGKAEVQLRNTQEAEQKLRALYDSAQNELEEQRVWIIKWKQEQNEKEDKQAQADSAEETRTEQARARDAARDDFDPMSGAGTDSSQLADLRAELVGLQGTVRHLRAMEAQQLYGIVIGDQGASNSALAWLHEPLVPAVQVKIDDTKRDRLKNGDALLDKFLAIVANAKSANIKESFAGIGKDGKGEEKGLHKVERLAWRPARQKSPWIVARQREEWEGWLRRAELWNRGVQ